MSSVLAAAEGDLQQAAEFGALPAGAIVVRGNQRHPCVSLTAEDVAAAKQRVERFGWAKKQKDKIIADAAPWLVGSDEYWLKFLPAAGAAYAYGFTGCPVCGARTGTWGEARCSWDEPGHVKCENGHLLPDAAHPDSGQGYEAADKRVHYFVGQFNAWVTEKWTMDALPALAQAYLLTGDERYADRGALFLDALSSIYKESTSGSWDYPSKQVSGRLARPWYQVARTLVIYADAYDWLYHSSAMDKPSHRPGFTRRKSIEECLLLDGARYCYERSWSGALNNGHADYLRGALAVGCLLDIPAYVDAAVNGPFSIQVMLANNIDRNGIYYETAPSYAVHARHLYLTYAEPLRNLRSREFPNGLNLFDSPGLAATLILPELQIQMQGRRPNYGDNAPQATFFAPPERLFNTTDYEFAERLYAMASSPERRQEYAAILGFLANGDLAALRARSAGNWELWHAAEPSAVMPPLSVSLEQRVKGSWFAGMSGLALLRDPQQAALLRFGPTLNHGDPDDLGLLYYSGGYELSYDIGYGLSTTHVQVGWASSTVSHALVTVNEKNQVAGGKGSGGSLLGFASLPNVRFIDADSKLSYSTENLRAYRRSLALVGAGYLVDCFHVEGGRQHDYGFGSIGTSLSAFGVGEIRAVPGSLAPDVAWGENIGPDGDVIGHPNKPAWNPPPGNGYGFFFNVRRARPAGPVWGGEWTLGGSSSAGKSSDEGAGGPMRKLRLYLAGDDAEPVYADAPGLYPRLPRSSYVLARRRGDDLKSTFLAVYEPFADDNDQPAPRIKDVERLGDQALAVRRVDGTLDIILFGPHEIDTPYGRLEFKGRFAFITGDGATVRRAELSGCERLSVDRRVLHEGRGVLTATVVQVDAPAGVVVLDADLPPVAEGVTAVFSHPRWTRTSAYQVRKAEGRKVTLDARSLSLGRGRVAKRSDPQTILSDVPHEFVRSALHTPTRFFDGKMILGRDGGMTRITGIQPGAPLKIGVEDGATLGEGETFDYLDLAPGDSLEIALPAVWSNER